MVYQILNRFFDICLLRLGPQDLPASQRLLQYALVANVVVSVVGTAPLTGVGTAIAQTLFGVLLFALLLHVALGWRRLRARFVQTFTAVMGCEALFGVVIFPLVLWMVRAQQADASTQTPLLLWLVIAIWYVVVLAHILRHAMSLTFALGMVFSMIYIALSWNLSALVFGEGG